MLSSFLRRGRRSVALLLLVSACFVLCTTAPRQAFCQAAEESRRGKLIDSGKNLFEEQRYEESIQTLSAALLRPGTSKADRIDVYRFLAYNYLVLSQTEEAEAAVRGLYVLDPEFTLRESESPRFRTFFTEVKDRWEKEGRPGLETESRATAASPSVKHVSPAEWESGKQVRVSGQIVDPANRAASVVIRYRSGSKGKFQRLEARLGQGHFRASIPGSAVKPPLVEYYIEVVDDGGLPIASRGDAAAPMRIAIPDPDGGPSVLASPWFWVAAAVVVGGGVTGAILLNKDSGSTSTQSAPPTSRVVVIIGN
jgi:hypothetical protein